MRSISITLAALLLMSATALPALSQTAAQTPPARPQFSPLAGDTAMRLLDVASFTAPKDWSISARTTTRLTVLDTPEGDSHIALVDVGEAADAKAAAAAAWTLYRPEKTWPVKIISPLPARDGWDERAYVDYESSPNDHVYIGALVLRKGTRWVVVIEDASQSTDEKRASAVTLLFQSVRPAGYSRETFAGKTAHPLDAGRVEAMRSFVESSIRQLGIPGASFALIDHGKVVYEGGVGVRELGKPAPADAHTLYMVASNTKGMSTLLLARLVDAGKLKWDEPVVKVYPAFRLGSDATTQKVQVKHLVCACTGLPRKDMEWALNTRRSTPASNTFALLAGTEPTSAFGELFQYNNLMAAAAGYIGGHIVYPDMELGAAYDKAMQTEIFAPLGMTETYLSIPAALANPDYARPHADNIYAKPTRISMDFNYSIMPYRPAGGAWSSAHDMIKYVQNELTQGVLPDGRRLVSAENLLARRARSVPTGEDMWYGMGLGEDATWGVSVIHHGGSMRGYKSDVLAIPDAQVGAVILANSDNGTALMRPFMRRLLEILYDGKPEAAASVASAARENEPQWAKFRERLVLTPGKADLAKLAGRYSNPDLGTIVVTKGRQVRFAFTTMTSAVASRKNDDGSTSFITTDPILTGVDFVAGTEKGKRTLTVRDSQHVYVFTEVAAKH